MGEEKRRESHTRRPQIASTNTCTVVVYLGFWCPLRWCMYISLNLGSATENNLTSSKFKSMSSSSQAMLWNWIASLPRCISSTRKQGKVVDVEKKDFTATLCYFFPPAIWVINQLEKTPYNWLFAFNLSFHLCRHPPCLHRPLLDFHLQLHLLFSKISISTLDLLCYILTIYCTYISIGFPTTTSRCSSAATTASFTLAHFLNNFLVHKTKFLWWRVYRYC